MFYAMCHIVVSPFDNFYILPLQVETNDNLVAILEKGTSRQRPGKGAIRKRFPLQKPRWEKKQTNNQALIP